MGEIRFDPPYYEKEGDIVGSITEGEFEYNKVCFKADTLWGQCGAYVLFDFEFPDRVSKRTVKSWSEEFTKELLRIGLGFKIILSAVQGSLLHQLVDGNPNWYYGPTSVNPNSGNTIQIFELNTPRGEE